MNFLLEQIYAHKAEILSLGALFTSGLYIYRLKFRAHTIENQFDLQNVRLDGKIVVITGANAGIGYETALDLARRGAHIILACRNLEKANHAARRIMRLTGNQHLTVKYLDLSSLDSVKQFCEQIAYLDHIDILINNAGVASTLREITSDGHELQFQVNYLGHYLLTRLLLSQISKSKNAKILCVISKLYESGRIHWEDFSLEKLVDSMAMEGYKQSKLCQIHFANELQNFLVQNLTNKNESIIDIFSVSPGIVLTNLGRDRIRKPFSKLLFGLFYPILWLLLKRPKQGAETVLYCCLKPDLKPKSGYYFRDCRQLKLMPHAYNLEDSKKLWKTSESMVEKWL